MKNFIVSFILLVFIVGCGKQVGCEKQVGCGKLKVGTGDYRSFEFVYSVDLDASPNKKMELWIPVPQSNEVQSISNLEVDAGGMNYEIKDENDHGNKYFYIYSDNGINSAKTVTMTFHVKREEHQNVKYDNVSNEKYLKASKMVPIGQIFQEVIENNNLKSDDMRELYDFVLNGMHYGKPTDDKNSGNYKYVYGGKNPKTGKEWLSNDITYGLKKKTRDELVKSQKGVYAYGNGNSMYACDIGVGNCTDYHSYFISLSRTMDVPARFHMGFPIPDGDKGIVKGYHCWADYYVDGQGWYPVDISEADKDPNAIDYYFGTVGSSRVEMMVGRDFSLDGYEQNPTNLFIYPLLEIDDKKSKNFKKKFTYRNL